MNTAEKWHGTTIVLLRKNGETAMAEDSQVSLGNTVLKSKAKVRKLKAGDYHKLQDQLRMHLLYLRG